MNSWHRALSYLQQVFESNIAPKLILPYCNCSLFCRMSGGSKSCRKTCRGPPKLGFRHSPAALGGAMRQLALLVLSAPGSYMDRSICRDALVTRIAPACLLEHRGELLWGLH